MKNSWKAETNKFRQNKTHKANPRRCGICFEYLDVEYDNDIAVKVTCKKCGVRHLTKENTSCIL